MSQAASKRVFEILADDDGTFPIGGETKVEPLHESGRLFITEAGYFVYEDDDGQFMFTIERRPGEAQAKGVSEVLYDGAWHPIPPSQVS